MTEEVKDQLEADGRMWYGSDGNGLPAVKRYLSEMEGMVPWTWWSHRDVGHSQDGMKQTMAILGREEGFVTAKPCGLIERCVRIGARTDSTLLDFFAGSGTTGHAVISLNREDGGRRKVIRLESYEDTLGNLDVDTTAGQPMLEFGDYLLHYMLEFETRSSAALLNIEKLAAPFAYRLEIFDGAERRVKTVDLPETFNYLMGIEVRTRRALTRDGAHRYLVIRGATNPNGIGGRRDVAVIWRTTKDWGQGDHEADRLFAEVDI